jgi:hypothetical protein
LSHELLRSGSVPEPEGPASLEGSADGGPAAAREGVGKVGGVVAVLSASGPWGQPIGPMEIHAVRRITGAPTGLVTTEIWRSLSSSSSPPSSSPCGSMTKGHRPVQAGWDSRNRGRHTARPDDPFDGHHGLRAMAGSPAGQGKGTGPL